MEYEYTTTDYSNLFDATTTTTTIEDPTMLAAFTAMMAGFGLFIFILSIALYVFFGIAMGKMFKKAGIPAWAAWVPFYNSWKFLEMGSFNGALILLSLIPGVGALIVSIITIISAYRIGLKFGKSGEYVALYIFLAPVWLGILGFGKAVWNGESSAASDVPTQPVNPNTFQPQYQAFQPQQPPVQPIETQPAQPFVQPPVQPLQQPVAPEQPQQPQPPVQPQI